MEQLNCTNVNTICLIYISRSGNTLLWLEGQQFVSKKSVVSFFSCCFSWRSIVIREEKVSFFIREFIALSKLGYFLIVSFECVECVLNISYSATVFNLSAVVIGPVVFAVISFECWTDVSHWLQGKNGA